MLGNGMLLTSPPGVMNLKVCAQTGAFLGEGGSMALAKHVLEHGLGNQRMRLLGGEPYLSLKWWDKFAGMRVSCSVRVGVWSWTSQLPGSDLVD